MEETNNSPQGIPSVTYVRILSSTSGDNNNDLQTEGNTITVTEPGQPPTKHEVAQLLEAGIGDQDVCENTIGNQAGAGKDFIYIVFLNVLFFLFLFYIYFLYIYLYMEI